HALATDKVLDEESSLELDEVFSLELEASNELLELTSEEVGSELLADEVGTLEDNSLELEELLFDPPQATRTLLNSSALIIFTFIFISLIHYIKKRFVPLSHGKKP